MSRADELRAKYESEMAVVELEDELVAMKDSDADPETLRAHKLRLRAARQEFRLQREGNAAVSPEAVRVAAGVLAVGGAD